MRTKHNSHRQFRAIGMVAVALVFMMVGALVGGTWNRDGVLAEAENTTQTESRVVYESPVKSVAANCIDSVVGVITNTQSWDRSSGQVTTTEMSEGSGVVIDNDGHILTNNHVVAEGSSYQVVLSDGSKVDAELVGADSSTDLAVLKVKDMTRLKVVTIGDSAQLEIGETVVAIGNPGGQVLNNTVTAGVVSALERDVGGFTRTVKTIQHDAAINPGNSGGGLFNASGELVGINTLKYTGSVYSATKYEGLGFAIPIDTAMPIAQQLIEYGKVRRPALGVTVTNWDGPNEALKDYPPASVRIVDVTAGGPAEAAGLKANDFITEIDGVKVTTMAELTTELDKHAEGDTVKLKVLRYSGLMFGNANPYGYSYGNGNGNDDSQNGGDTPYWWGSGYGNGSNSQAYTNTQVGYETIEVEVTLKVME